MSADFLFKLNNDSTEQAHWSKYV